MPKPKLFKNTPTKRLCKNAAKKCGEKRGTVRRVLRAMEAAAAEMAADRPAYFARFIHAWRFAAANVDALADAVMLHPKLEIPGEAIEAVLSPYTLESLYFYRQLAGVLNYAEEYEFVETSKVLAGAWIKLCGIVRARPNVSARDVDLLQSAVGFLNPRVADIYQGAAHSEPDGEWIRALDDAGDAFRRIAKGLAS